MRNPLQKERFLQGTRQKWFAVLLGFSVIILVCDTRADLDAAAYLNFLTITGSIFILGASADSVLKIKAAEKNETNRQPEEHNEGYCERDR